MSLHHYNTRKHEYVYYVKHEFAKKSLKYTIPKLLNETPTFIKDKVHTHSLIGFKSYTKNYYLSCYSLECSSPQNCYICQNNLHQLIDSLIPQFIMLIVNSTTFQRLNLCNYVNYVSVINIVI